MKALSQNRPESKSIRSEFGREIGTALEMLAKKIPIADHCPLIQKKNWNCKPYDQGNETKCRSINGYSNCDRFQAWLFHAIIREIAKLAEKNEKKK